MTIPPVEPWFPGIRATSRSPWSRSGTSSERSKLPLIFTEPVSHISSHFPCSAVLLWTRLRLQSRFGRGVVSERMQLRMLGVVLAYFASPCHGQHVWEKPVERWTSDDASRVLTNSPWAKPATMKIPGEEPVGIIVRWETALPVQAALQKLGLLPVIGSRRSSEGAIAVVTFPKEWARTNRSRINDWQRAKAWLEATGTQATPAKETRILEAEDGIPMLAFAFAKSRALLEPAAFRLPFFSRNLKRLTVRMVLGQSSVSSSFKLPDMFFLGMPEL